MLRVDAEIQSGLKIPPLIHFRHNVTFKNKNVMEHGHCPMPIPLPKPILKINSNVKICLKIPPLQETNVAVN